MLEVSGKIDPAFVGLQQDVLIGRFVELAPGCVQRRNAGVAAASKVDGREVERQAQEVVAQRAGDELVDLVADLSRHAADDGSCGDVGVDDGVGAVVQELDRIEEALDQSDMILVEVRVEAIDRLGQHRVAEAVDHMRELGDDRRIDGDIEAVGHEEYVDVGLDLARELLEHEMLVLHFGAELRGLEQAFAIPYEVVDCRADWNGRNVVDEPFVQERHGLRLRRAAGEHCRGILQDDRLGVLDKPVVLGMEDVVDGGEADILVGATVAGDKVRVEQFVVVARHRTAGSGLPSPISMSPSASPVRHRVVGDVGKEGMTGPEG